MPQGMSRERERLLRLYGAEVELIESLGGHERGGGGGAPHRRRARRLLHPRPVLEPGQPGDPPAHHRRGDLARHGRQGGRARGRRGHRRHHHGLRRAAQGAQPGPARGGGGAGGSSPVLSGGTPGPHKIQGIGAGLRARRSSTARSSTRSCPWTTRTRIDTARLCARREGVLAGISCGAALWARDRRSARARRCAGKRIVVIMPDSGERYVSTPFFAP